MARLLPTQTDASVERSDDPALLSLDDEATREVIEALSSETAYEIFQFLNEEPATPTRIA
jgi:DNA-binding transcriptional ArsR family regulator